MIIKKLGELFEIGWGRYSIKGEQVNKEYINKNKGQYPIYTSKLEPLGYVKYFDYEGEHIIFYWSQKWYNGVAMFKNEKFSVTSNSCVFEPKNNNNDLYITKFVFYWLWKKRKGKIIWIPFLDKHINTLSVDKFKDIEIQLPSIDKQKEIVNIIDSVEKLENKANEIYQKINSILNKNKLLNNTKTLETFKNKIFELKDKLDQLKDKMIKSLI